MTNTYRLPVLKHVLRIGKQMSLKWGLLMALLAITLVSHLGAQTPCEDGVAGQYPCYGMDLMSVRNLEELGGVSTGDGNDCWGWTYEGREFVLFGRSDGTSIVEITDPVNPVLVANVPTASVSSLWRDIKVIGDVAFIVSEANSHGMQILDLNEIVNIEPGSILEPTAYYDGFGSAHNVVANPETGFVYAVGTEFFNGGLFAVDCNDPFNPNPAGSWSEHDVHDAQVVVYSGPDIDYAGKEIAFAFTGYSGFHVVDVDDKTDMYTVSALADSQWVYVHQGWLTEDQRFIFMNDEMDETSGIATTTRTWVLNVEDLDSPFVVGFHEGPVEVTDHNLYTKGDKVYAANYYAGIHVFDIVDAASAEIALSSSFDTNPFLDQTGTSGGAWSVYPYFESGNIAISTQSHMFVVHPSGEADAVERAPQPLPQIEVRILQGRVQIQSNSRTEALVYDVMGRHQATWPLSSSGWSTFLTEGWSSGTYVLKTASGYSQVFSTH